VKTIENYLCINLLGKSTDSEGCFWFLLWC